MLRTLGSRFAKPLLWKVDQLAALGQLRGIKADTGIVGLKVVPNAREVLREKLNDVLQAISEQIPEQAEYRKAVEATMQFRCVRRPLSILDDHPDHLTTLVRHGEILPIYAASSLPLNTGMSNDTPVRAIPLHSLCRGYSHC